MSRRRYNYDRESAFWSFPSSYAALPLAGANGFGAVGGDLLPRNTQYESPNILQVKYNCTNNNNEIDINIEDSRDDGENPFTLTASSSGTANVLATPATNTGTFVYDSDLITDRSVPQVDLYYPYAAIYSTTSANPGPQFIAFYARSTAYKYFGLVRVFAVIQNQLPAFCEGISSTLFCSPMNFNASKSYVLKNNGEEFNYLNVSNKLEEYASNNSDMVLMPSKTITHTGVNGTDSSSCSVTLEITGARRYPTVLMKLLNREDAELCRTTPVGSLDETFFNSLSSPTLQEATTNGGAQYWGVLRNHRSPFSALDVSWNIDTSYTCGGTGGTASSGVRFNIFGGFLGSTNESGEIIEADNIVGDNEREYIYRPNGYRYAPLYSSSTTPNNALVLRP